MTDVAATGRFEIDIKPGEELFPTIGRFNFEKTWTGAVEGTSRGVMLSAGDPAEGSAGYVAIEHFVGQVEGRVGTLVFQQFGTMHDGADALQYSIVPGSGTGQLAGAAGELLIDATGGDHLIELRLRFG